MVLRRVLTLIASVAALTASSMGAGAGAGGGGGDYWHQTPPDGQFTAGPPYRYVTSIMTGDVEPLMDVLALERTRLGYRLLSGNHNNHLTVTLTSTGKLRFVDTGTKRWRRIPAACQRRRVAKGVAAVCRVPDGISARAPLLLEIWPRLGHDYTDTRSLPASFAVTVLADRGRDVAWLGAGDDFFNGHTGVDRVHGSGGDDWLRTGDTRDFAWGGPGRDQLVGMQGDDELTGGDGDDRLDGMTGADRLVGGSGADRLYCGDGRDTALSEAIDRLLSCERR